MGPLPCWVTELHIRKAADYTDLFLDQKTAASLLSRNDYQFNPVDARYLKPTSFEDSK